MSCPNQLNKTHPIDKLGTTIGYTTNQSIQLTVVQFPVQSLTNKEKAWPQRKSRQYNNESDKHSAYDNVQNHIPR